MIQPIRFFVQGLPKGQPRPKAFSRGGHARVYDPGTAEGWKGQVAVAARPFIPEAPLTHPVSIRLVFYFPRPKSHFRGGVCERGRLKADAPIFHTSKPDFDNLAKAVTDALTVLRMWTDDALVANAHVTKRYDNLTDGPGCAVAISPAI